MGNVWSLGYFQQTGMSRSMHQHIAVTYELYIYHSLIQSHRYGFFWDSLRCIVYHEISHDYLLPGNWRQGTNMTSAHTEPRQYIKIKSKTTSWYRNGSHVLTSMIQWYCNILQLIGFYVRYIASSKVLYLAWLPSGKASRLSSEHNMRQINIAAISNKSLKMWLC